MKGNNIYVASDTSQVEQSRQRNFLSVVFTFFAQCILRLPLTNYWKIQDQLVFLLLCLVGISIPILIKRNIHRKMKVTDLRGREHPRCVPAFSPTDPKNLDFMRVFCKIVCWYPSPKFSSTLYGVSWIHPWSFMFARTQSSSRWWDWPGRVQLGQLSSRSDGQCYERLYLLQDFSEQVWCILMGCSCREFGLNEVVICSTTECANWTTPQNTSQFSWKFPRERIPRFLYFLFPRTFILQGVTGTDFTLFSPSKDIHPTGRKRHRLYICCAFQGKIQ